MEPAALLNALNALKSNKIKVAELVTDAHPLSTYLSSLRPEKSFWGHHMLNWKPDQCMNIIMQTPTFKVHLIYLS